MRTIAAYHPASTVALSGVALLAFGPTRRLLYRMTIARFRSEEGAFRSAEVRLKALQDSTTQSAMEARKLEERLAAAQQEYSRGLAKLQGTGQQLLALSRGLRAMERNTDGVSSGWPVYYVCACMCPPTALLGDLRQLPSKAALQLRSQAATVAATAKQQRATVERHVNALLKQGLV